jgi:hypothetical protein
MEPALETWARAAAPNFRANGAAAGADLDFARLYILTWSKGLNPRISRIWASPDRQRFLQNEWDHGRGKKYGLRVRPVSNSKHIKTTFMGRPASTAMDMPTNNDKEASRLAGTLKIGSGLSFQEKDPGHYFSGHG